MLLENIKKFFKKTEKIEPENLTSKNTAKERLHLALMQDRADVSADFLELMIQEIIDVIKKYIEVDEDALDIRLTHNTKEDGTQGVPTLYANIPISKVKNENKKENEQKLISNKLNDKKEIPVKEGKHLKKEESDRNQQEQKKQGN